MQYKSNPCFSQRPRTVEINWNYTLIKMLNRSKNKAKWQNTFPTRMDYGEGKFTKYICVHKNKENERRRHIQMIELRSVGWIWEELPGSLGWWSVDTYLTKVTSREARSIPHPQNPETFSRFLVYRGLHRKVSFEWNFCLFKHDSAVSIYFTFLIRLGLIFLSKLT